MISIPPKGDNEKRVNAHFTPLMVEAQTSPDMTVKIQPGSFWTAMGTHVEYIGGNSPVLTAPTVDAKWIVISLNGDGLVEVLNGVPGSNPDLPAIPETHIPLSGIFIGDTTLQVTSDMVFDIRPMWSVRPENIPNLAGELASRPTATQMNAAIALKADMAGTNSPTFILNQDHVGVTSTDAELIVERGSEPNVSIRWSETMEQWQFSNDGSTWGPIGMSAGVFYTKLELDSGALDGQYYEKSLLDSGVMDSRYYTEAEADAIFASVTHTHVAADITDISTVVAASAPIQTVAGRTGFITLTEADITNLDKYATVGGAVSGNLTAFGASNDLVDTGNSISDLALVSHTHITSNITDFVTATNTLISTSPISALADVVSAGATDGHVLTFDTTSGWYVNRFLTATELSDVEIVGVANGEVLQHNGVKFINHLPVKSDISDFADSDYVLTLGTVAQSITGAKTFDDAVVMSDGVTVTGASTILNTTIVDTIAEMINLNVGQPATDAGLVVKRDLLQDAKLFWDETGSQWTAGPNGSGQYQPIVLGAHAHASVEITDWVSAFTASLNANNLDTIQDVAYGTSPVVNEYLIYDGTDWVNTIPIAANISDFAAATTTELAANNLNTLQDVAYIAPLADRDVMVWDGLVDNQWENRALVKADVSDFVEVDYVHVLGAETIAGAKTFSDDMVVNGNLTINGTTTTVNSTDVAISDNIFVLNKDEVGAGVSLGTAGIEIKRGSEQDVMLYWDEATDTWRAHHNPGAGLVVDTLSFQGHQHILADLTDITVNALAVNQLAGIGTAVTVQTQLNDKISRTGDVMDATANLAFSTGGEVTGLPAIPSGVTAATSQKYVDDQDTAISLIMTTHISDDTRHLTTNQNTLMDALNLPTLTGVEVNHLIGVTALIQPQIDSKIGRAGDVMNLNANLAFNGGQVTGLPAVPSVTAATSKEYVDAQLLGHTSDDTRHLTANQNTFMDGLNLPTLVAAEVNQLVGVTSAVQTQLNSKAALAVPVTAGNLASLTVLGDLADSGVILNDGAVGVADLWSASKLTTDFSTKADKVGGATVGNFASLDASGNLVDSGSTTADFATAIHTHIATDITDFNTAVGLYVTGTQQLFDMSDVSGIASTGDLLQKTPTGWQNVAPNNIVEFVNTTTLQAIGGDKTFANNVTVSGDFTVNGTTSTINTVDLNVQDKNIVLNDGYTGLPSGSTGAGLHVIRGVLTGLGQDASFVWDEALGQWKGGINGSEIVLAQLGVNVAQPDYEIFVGTGVGTPQYTASISVPTPVGSKRAIQVFVNGLKYVEGVGKGYTVDSYGPITITFTAGNEPSVGDDIEIYGFGYIS